MTERVNITLPADLLVKLDAAAEREHTTRSGYLRAAVLQRMGSGEAAAPGDAGVARETAAAYAPAGPTPPPATSLATVAPLLRAFFSARDDVLGAWVFGSVAEGTAGPLSDVDVAVLTAPALDRKRARDELRLELMGRLASVLRTEPVDVVAIQDAPPLLGHSIVRGGVLVFGEHEPEVAEAEAAALRAYEGFRPVLAERRRVLRERIAGYARA